MEPLQNFCIKRVNFCRTSAMYMRDSAISGVFVRPFVCLSVRLSVRVFYTVRPFNIIVI